MKAISLTKIDRDFEQNIEVLFIVRRKFSAAALREKMKDPSVRKAMKSAGWDLAEVRRAIGAAL